MKKYLILLLVLAGCTQEYTFQAYTNNKYVKDEDVVIKDENGVIETGTLPMGLKGEEGTVLIAEFEVHVSNFGINHPQCNCKQISYIYYKCAEEFEINGKDWEIAK